jgi:hypothetical protein
MGRTSKIRMPEVGAKISRKKIKNRGQGERNDEVSRADKTA